MGTRVLTVQYMGGVLVDVEKGSSMLKEPPVCPYRGVFLLSLASRNRTWRSCRTLSRPATRRTSGLPGNHGGSVPIGAVDRWIDEVMG